MSKWREGNPRGWLLVFALAHVAIFAGLFRTVYAIPSSPGTGLFYNDASHLVSGQLPYRDFLLEYPPIALVFFTIPRMVARPFYLYYEWYQVEVIIADLVALGALYAAARRWNLDVWRVLAVYTLAVLAIGPINHEQFDIFPATLTLLAVIWFAARRDVGAWVFLGLGTMTKVYPALLAPVFAVLEWKRSGWRRLPRGALAFGATCVVPLVPWLIVAPKSLAALFAFHAERGIQIESTYSSLGFAGRLLNLGWVDVVSSFRSINVAGPFVDVLARVSTPILIVVLAVAYVVIERRSRAQPAAADDVVFVGHAAAFVLLAAMASSKVLSPQYFVWVIPFVPFMSRARGNIAVVAFVVLGVVTYYVYPVHYDELAGGWPGAILALDLRNLLLIGLAVYLGKSFPAPRVATVWDGAASPSIPTPA